MKSFKDFGIKPTIQSLQGDKININRILNREIVVEDFRLDDSKFGGGGQKCLCIQFTMGTSRHVIFTGSKILIETILQIPKSDFPFKTTIVRDSERFEFT